MKILQRLRNLWKLGEVELFPNGQYQKVNPISGKPIIPEIKMAQIIKRKSPEKVIEELLNEE